MAVKSEDTSDAAVSDKNEPSNPAYQQVNADLDKIADAGKTGDLPIVQELREVVQKLVDGS